MDSLEVNKGVAAVLVAGIAFFLAGTLGDQLVREERPSKPALDIKTAAPASAPAAASAPELPPIMPLLAKADPAAGEAITKKLCVVCHTFNEGGKAGVGPNLYGVVGAPHGHMEGFNYSAGMKAKQGPWTFAELNQWLHQPSSYVPGTRMAFAGIRNDQERANVIDYLRTLSKTPEPIPAAAPANAPPPTPGGAAPQTGGSGGAAATGGNTGSPAASTGGPTAGSSGTNP